MERRAAVNQRRTARRIQFFLTLPARQVDDELNFAAGFKPTGGIMQNHRDAKSGRPGSETHVHIRITAGVLEHTDAAIEALESVVAARGVTTGTGPHQ